jgi:WD40 repeat protein/serine/threonine protein kinase
VRDATLDLPADRLNATLDHPPTTPIATLNLPDPPAAADAGTLPSRGSASAGAPTGPAPAVAGHKTVGQYEIERELGRGGMGVVYQALDRRLKRRVALKMVLAGSHAGGEAMTRFRQEAEAIARLQHPNIVQIYEIGEHDGLPFFSLEFVDGGSLDRRLAGTPQQPHEAARLVAVLARAMDVAHQQGIVHRDLKPANVLLTGGAEGAASGHHPTVPAPSSAARSTVAATAGAALRGNTASAPPSRTPPASSSRPLSTLVPKIADFGLAKQLDDAEGRTASGAIMGTPSYMAPEQAVGDIKAIGPRTDVYALGAILYECLTGRPPFKGATAMDTLVMVRGDESVPPSRLHRGVPRDLETICLTCLQKAPARRYPSAAALAEDLERFLRGEPVEARPAGRVERAVKWARRRPAVAGLIAVSALALLVVLTGLAYFTSRLNQRNSDLGEALKRAEDETEAKVREGIAKDQALTDAKKARGDAEAARRDTQRNLYFAEMNLAGQAAHASGGGGGGLLREMLSHWRPARGEPDLRGWEWYYLRSHLQEPRLILHRHRDLVNDVCWSPDGTRLASGGTDETVMIWDARTGQPLKTLRGHKKAVKAVAWCPDGRTLASADDGGLVQLRDAATGQPLRQLRHGASVRGIAFTPDGSQLACATEDGQVKVWRTCDGEITFSHKGTSLMRFVRFNPGGTRLAAGDIKGLIYVWDLATGTLLTSPWRPGNGWVGGLSWSPDGRRLASAGVDTLPPAVTMWDPDTGRQLGPPLTGHTAGVHGIDWSPDGRYVADGAADLTTRIWDAKSGRLLLTLQGQVGHLPTVSWSPDSTRLAVSADQTVVVWDVPALLTGSSLSGDTLGPITKMRWRPDGQVLALAGRNGVVSLRDVTTGRETATLSGQASTIWSLAWRPDGQRLAVSSNRPEICIWDVAMSRVVATLDGHTAGVTCLAWSRDGGRLASASHDGTVRVWDPDHQAELARFSGHGNSLYKSVFVVSWSPDGRQLASSGADETVHIWDLEAGKELHDLGFLKSWIHAMSWSPNSASLATEYDAQWIKLWDAQTRRETGLLRGHTSGIMALCWSPDGQRLASGARDQTVRVWDPVTGRQTLTLPANRQAMGAIEWSPDGRWLGSVDELQNTIRLWDALPGYLAERSPLALPELDRRLRTNPRSVPDRLLRAEVFARTGKWQGAAADWEEAGSVQPADSAWFIGGWWVAGPFSEASDFPEETAGDVDPVRPPVGESSAPGWRAADASSDGCLDLTELLPHRTEKERACVLVRVYSPREQVATALLDSTGDLRLRVNGTVVKELKATRPPRTEDEPVSVTLKAGWNTLLFRVGVGEEQDQLRLWLRRRNAGS